MASQTQSWTIPLSVGYSRHVVPFQGYMKHDDSDHRVLLRLQAKGRCRVSVNGVTYPVEPGDLILRRPCEEYRLDIEAVYDEQDGVMLPIDSVDYYLTCDGEWIENWARRSKVQGIVRVEPIDELMSLWRKLIYEKRNLHGDNSEMMDALVKVICLSIDQHAQKAGSASRPERYIPYQIKRYLEKHATEPLKLDRVAARFGVSVSTASHLFKGTFGLPPMRYVVDIRLAIASERLLHSDMNLEDIAEASGFRSYPYFSRAFRSRYNVSPSEYRARNGLQTH
ncbi:AraC family transcriptional regulator [Paenibacillus agaridevorans]|uniref:AraC family transcriptional regulator n=1 Tax=Paenibacillus agaridevorans TaxID=171404 RepID=UPI001BE42BBB|nr:AraC family transcriptional regulator [Paenibacillus agaridevorans]